jgi:hypothetical protein
MYGRASSFSFFFFLPGVFFSFAFVWDLDFVLVFVVVLVFHTPSIRILEKKVVNKDKNPT